MKDIEYPNNWKKGILEDYADFKNGINFSKSQKGNKGIPTIDVRNMYGRGWAVNLDNLYKVNKSINEDYYLKTGDLLFVRSSLKLEGIGWTTLFAGSDEPVTFCGFIIRARLRAHDILDPLFLTYFFRSDEARKNLISGSGKVAITNISQAVLKKTPIPLPPLPEQKKIAHILSTVQQAIEQQEQIITLTTELKKALMHKLFTEGLRGEPQKETEIGLVPESWEVVKLGELAKKPEGRIQTGPFGSQLHKDEYQNSGIPVVNPTHLIGNRINHDDVPRIAPKKAEELSRHKLLVGDILFARRGEIGRHGLVTENEQEWLCGTGSFLVRIRKDFVDNRFISYYFSTQRAISWLESHAAGAIMPNLNSTVLSLAPIPIPCIEEQREIAELFDFIEKKLLIIEKRKNQYQDLFRTLLHQLMTAQIRVHELEFEENV